MRACVSTLYNWACLRKSKWKGKEKEKESLKFFLSLFILLLLFWTVSTNIDWFTCFDVRSFSLSSWTYQPTIEQTYRQIDRQADRQTYRHPWPMASTFNQLTRIYVQRYQVHTSALSDWREREAELVQHWLASCLTEREREQYCPWHLKTNFSSSLEKGQILDS